MTAGRPTRGRRRPVWSPCLVRKPSTAAPSATARLGQAARSGSTSAIGRPSSSTIAAPASSTAARARIADPQRLDDRLDDLVRRPLAIDLGSERGEHLAWTRRLRRSCLVRHRHILPGGARLSSAGDERRHARGPAVTAGSPPRPRRADAQRRGRSSRPRGPCTTSRTRSSRSPSCPGAIGLYLVNDDQFGERDGNVLLSIAIVVSVGINALVSPILGALSDRGAGRMPFLLFFTALCIGATFFIADVPPVLGLVLFIVANFAYQAALIYYDATLKTVSYPETRGRLSGIGTAIGYFGHRLRRAR